MLIFLLLSIPIVGSIALFILSEHKLVSSINSICSLLTFICALLIIDTIATKGVISVGYNWFYVDHLSAFLILITTFISLTTAHYSAKYLINEQYILKLTKKNVRFFYGLYQFFCFTALLILVTNNLGILWVAMECATLITVLLVSFYRSKQSLEASWKYLILCGVGLAQALLGTILLFFAAKEVDGIHNALNWSELHAVSSQLSPTVVSIAFVFILIGYGTKAGFVPLHNWLPDVYGESMTSVLSLLSGILLNLAFYAILRFKIIVDGSVGISFTSPFLLCFGLLNIIIAALFLLRQRDIKRLFAYSSIEHIGIISFAFGIGTSLAIFAGLLHMMAHSLSKTAAFFSAGQIIQIQNTSRMENIRGIVHQFPSLGWGLLLSSFALIGLPPSALFISEFLIIFATVKDQFWLAIPLTIGLLIAFAAILRQIQRMVFYPNSLENDTKNLKLSIFPIYLHLGLIAMLGLLIPVFLTDWFDHIIQMMNKAI